MKPGTDAIWIVMAQRQCSAVWKLLLASSQSYPGKPLFWDCRILYPLRSGVFFAVCRHESV